MRATICILLVIGLSSCRTLNGDYYESFGQGWGGADYHFGKDGSFTYHASYDVGELVGEGTYHIGLIRIRFEFDSTTPPLQTPAELVIETRDTGDHSRDLHILVLDENSLEVVYAIVVANYNGTRIGAATDLEGKAKLVFQNNVDSVRLLVKCVGYAVVDTPISVKSVYRATIKMIPSETSGMCSSIDSGTVWKYRFRENRLGVVTLKRNEYSIKYNEEYRRYLSRKRRRLILLPR